METQDKVCRNKYCQCDNIVCTKIRQYCDFHNKWFALCFGIALGASLALILNYLGEFLSRVL
jgi:hypothetical protein